MALYWPQHGIAIQIDDDPYSMPFDEEAFPEASVYHITCDEACDVESMTALAHHIAHEHGIELDPDIDELIGSRRATLHTLFGASPQTFAQVYAGRDAA